MSFDSWGVLPGLEEDEFILAYKAQSPAQGKPFMKMSDPMTEEKVREELKNIGVSDALVDAAIAKAKDGWKPIP